MAAASSSTELVNPWRISTRLSKSMTLARSSSRSRSENPMAACWAVSIRSVMLALVSMSSESAMGSWVRVKNVMSCSAPSS